ncbi:hypothetical protein CLOM621_08424 [Clostridium sp. M62/1]|nr:hypothetical protein CLOM621_08424 [Clostridium sp. M62/1]
MKIQLIFQMEKIAGPIFAIYIIFLKNSLLFFFVCTTIINTKW